MKHLKFICNFNSVWSNDLLYPINVSHRLCSMPTFFLVIDSIFHVEVKIYPLIPSFVSFLLLNIISLHCVYLPLPILRYHCISNQQNKPTKRRKIAKLTINQRLWLCTLTLSSFIDIGLCNLYRFFHDIKSITVKGLKRTWSIRLLSSSLLI